VVDRQHAKLALPHEDFPSPQKEEDMMFSTPCDFYFSEQPVVMLGAVISFSELQLAMKARCNLAPHH
jgi:hypothetical protein